jgi:hypothetical protein
MIRSRDILLHPTLGRTLESTAPPATEHPVIRRVRRRGSRGRGFPNPNSHSNWLKTWGQVTPSGFRQDDFVDRVLWPPRAMRAKRGNYQVSWISEIDENGPAMRELGPNSLDF